jgi:hypothetical protein
VAAALKVVPQAVVVGVTALHLLGVDIGPPKPLYLVSCNPHPVRRAELSVARVGALPRHSGSVAVAEHAFASAASQLNLLDLVTAGTGWYAGTDAVCPPCRRTHRISPVAEPSPRVVPPDLSAPGSTRYQRPGCGSA